MSAGAVPVVLARGGQPEIVRDGIDGLHFTDEAGLIDATDRLANDNDMRRRLSASATRRAREFDVDVFAERLTDIVRDVTRTESRAG